MRPVSVGKIILCWGFVLALGLNAVSDAQPGKSPLKKSVRKYHIGYRLLKAPTEETEPLTVCLWYPTTEGPGQHSYRIVAREMKSDARLDARPARGPFPLIIFSHGGGGCGIMGATFAETLAVNGFVVAAPDHHDEFSVMRSDAESAPDRERVGQWLKWAHGVSSGTRRTRFAHRPKEVTAAIDYLLAENEKSDSPLRGLIDPKRIGAMGVSFGAWTTQVVAGFIPTFADARIRAACPIAGRPGRRIGGYENIKVPLLVIFGEKETMVLFNKETGLKTEVMVNDFGRMHPPKILVGIKDAHHMEFGGAGAFTRLKAKELPPSSKVRAEDSVISEVNRYTVPFFRRYLSGDRSREEALKKKGPNTFLLKAEL